MRGFYLLILFTFCSSFSSTAFSKEKLHYYVIEKVAEPFQIIKGTQQTGVVSDVLDKIIGLEKLNIETYPFARMTKEMISKNTKRWINYGAVKWGPPQGTNLSEESVIDVQHVLLTAKNFEYSTIEDLYKKRIVLIRGFSYPGLEKYIKLKKFKVLYVDSYNAVFRALSIGRAVAFPGMELRILYHLKKSGIPLEKFNLFNISNLIEDYPIHIAYDEKFPKEIKSIIDAKLKRLKESGGVQKIIEKYVSQ